MANQGDIRQIMDQLDSLERDIDILINQTDMSYQDAYVLVDKISLIEQNIDQLIKIGG